MTVQDALHSFRFHTVVSSPTLRETFTQRPAVQAVFVGLSWTFGAPSKRPRDQGFDFGGAAPQP